MIGLTTTLNSHDLRERAIRNDPVARSAMMPSARTVLGAR